jgi:hypothetical protein
MEGWDFVRVRCLQSHLEIPMPDPVTDFLAALGKWVPEDEPLPLLEGAVDPHRSDEKFLLFALDPCRGPWTRIPTEAVAAVRLIGDEGCGPAVFPRVQVELDGSAPAALTVVDAVRAASRTPASPAGAAQTLGGEPAEGTASHDVHVEVRPEGKLYRIRLQLEGHDVRRMDWDPKRKVYVADVQGLPVEDALEVVLQGWGNRDAKLSLSVEVDGRVLTPGMEATITDRPAEARRSYPL